MPLYNEVAAWQYFSSIIQPKRTENKINIEVLTVAIKSQIIKFKKKRYRSMFLQVKAEPHNKVSFRG